MNLPLTLADIQAEANQFAILVSQLPEPKLYGVDNGKIIGTHIERTFKAYLSRKYLYDLGNAASGLDFPDLNLDVKTTSIIQPQSSCPYKSARQKIFGLGYSLLVFVYAKTDDPATRTSLLDIKHAVYVDSSRTADFQLTTELNRIIENDGNEDDLIAQMHSKVLPVDDIEAASIAAQLMAMGQIAVGYLTISNALQWRLQYTRVIAQAGKVDGIVKIF